MFSDLTKVEITVMVFAYPAVNILVHFFLSGSYITSSSFYHLVGFFEVFSIMSLGRLWLNKTEKSQISLFLSIIIHTIKAPLQLTEMHFQPQGQRIRQIFESFCYKLLLCSNFFYFPISVQTTKLWKNLLGVHRLGFH